jgi:hypothetical protein
VTLRNIRQLRGVTAVSLDGHLMHLQLEALPPAPSPRWPRGVGGGKGAVHMSLDLSRIPTLPQRTSVPSSERARARGVPSRDDWGTALAPYSSPRRKPRVPPLPSTWQPQPPSNTHATRTPRDVRYDHTPQLLTLVTAETTILLCPTKEARGSGIARVHVTAALSPWGGGRALHGGDRRQASSVLTEPDVRRLMVHAEDAGFGDRLITRMVLEHWRRGFNLSQPFNFSSMALHIETRLDAGLREAAGWEQVYPSPIVTTNLHPSTLAPLWCASQQLIVPCVFDVAEVSPADDLRGLWRGPVCCWSTESCSTVCLGRGCLVHAPSTTTACTHACTHSATTGD